MATESIIQLKITLQDSKPPIWRRLLVDKSITFKELHYIIQISMGWENSHLYQFETNEYIITTIDEYIDEDDYFDKKLVDASSITLNSIITNVKMKFTYTYDFGDDWQHQILVEKFLDYDEKIKYPTCIKGKLNCPPEDSGGIYGFYELLEIIADIKHKERKEVLRWIGKNYDPEHFDKDEINTKLAKFFKKTRT